jgi:hypothetical protein
MQHDVRALCLQTQAECDASFPAGTAYRDPEQDEGLFRFGPDAQAAYRQRHRQHFEQLTTMCRQNDIGALTACIEQPLASVLRSWLRQAGRA